MTRIRFQLPGALFFAVIMPVWLRWNEYLPGDTPANIYNAQIGAALAILLGFLSMRRLVEIPGVQAGSSLLLAYTLPFMLVVVGFFLLRLEYSRFVFALSFIITLLWFGVLFVVTERHRRITLAVVPGGNAKSLTRLGGIDWMVLKKPPQSISGIAAVSADLRHEHSDDWQHFLADCALAGVPVFHSKQLSESLTGKVDIEHLSENTFGSLLPNMVYLKIKELADITLAILAFPFFVVLVLVLGPLIVATSGWPIFFTQERIGYGGKTFQMVKFRTMTSGPAQMSLQEAALNGGRDKRVTWIGHYLRKYRIDEVPQIINIIRGEMSWIGPRPEALTLSKWYENELPFYRYRHVVRPGISGWAQVNQGHVARPDQVLEKLHYDFYYIKHLSPFLDLLIVIRTIRTILTGFGSR